MCGYCPQQAQQANELIGTKTLRALGPLQLPCSVYTSTGGANTAAAATSEALSVATPTLEQLLCLPKEGAEGLLQKLLLQLQLREEDSKQQHLLQRHLDAAHSALVELEAQIYILQEEQHKLCQVLRALVSVFLLVCCTSCCCWHWFAVAAAGAGWCCCCSVTVKPPSAAALAAVLPFRKGHGGFLTAAV